MTRLSSSKLLRGCILCYCMGVSWLMLFPVISITTGELKPRGLYVDEHALLTTSVQREVVQIRHNNYSYTDRFGEVCSENQVVNTGICEALSFVHLSHFPCRAYTSRAAPLDSLTTVLVQPKDRPASSEEHTAVVIALDPSGTTPGWVVDLSVALMQHLRATAWLSRSVIFVFTASPPATVLFTNTDSDAEWGAGGAISSSPRMLRRWLEAFHSPGEGEADGGSGSGSGEAFDFLLFPGILRDALVLDFTDPDPAILSDRSSDALGCTGSTGADHCFAAPSSSLSPVPPQEWADGYLLRICGSNGLLPNMDVPAALLSMEPALLHLETAPERRLLERYATQDSLLAGVLPGDSSSVRVRRYHWASLLLGMRRMLRGGDGWHALFLQHNIEAFTLRPMTPTAALSPRKQSKAARRKTNERTAASSSAASATPAHLLSLIVRHLHTSSNLHEELHHSFFLYLLMGHRHFVGLPEYASCLLLLVVPLYLLFLAMYDLITCSPLPAPARGPGTVSEDASAVLENDVSVPVLLSPDLERTSCGSAALAESLHVSALREELLCRGARSALMDLCSGVTVCAAGLCFLREHLALSGAVAPGGSSDLSSFVSTSVVLLSKAAHRAVVPACLRVHAQAGGCAETWFCFITVCSSSYALLLVCGHIASPLRKAQADKASREAEGEGEGGVRGGRSASSGDRDGSGATWLQGHILCFLLILSCWMSVVSMHHSVLGFCLLLPLVPLALLLVLFAASSGPAARGKAEVPVVDVLLHGGKCGAALLTSVALSPPALLLIAFVHTTRSNESSLDSALPGAATSFDAAKFLAFCSRLLMDFVDEGSVVVPYVFVLTWLLSCALFRTALTNLSRLSGLVSDMSEHNPLPPDRNT